jgi:hypothetical protein
MPQKIMASPFNVFDFYDTFQYDVVNTALSSPSSVDSNGLRYVYLSSRHFVNVSDPSFVDFFPLQRQVQGPASMPDLGFYFLNREKSAELRETQPIISSNEWYYVRVSGEKGQSLYDVYAREILPGAFNRDRDRGRTSNFTGVNEEGKTKFEREVTGIPSIERISVYFSGKNAVTNLHYDTSGKGSVICQLTGRKRIQLWPPHSAEMEEIMQPYQPSTHPFHRRSRYNGRSPQIDSRALLEKREHDLILKEGWCLYFPVLWWHHVESLDEENISIRFTVE